MTYIIENANILKEDKLKKVSLLVKTNEFSLMQPELKRFQFTRMDAAPFIMTSGFIVLDTEIPLEKPFLELKDYYIKEFILKGCTAFLTAAAVKHEYSMKSDIKGLRARLLSSPIDYIIGVRIPVRLLTPSFMRKCKRERVPVVFVEVRDTQELEQVPWGWIRESMFPYNCPLAPVFLGRNEKEKSRIKRVWDRLMKEQKIPSMPDELKEHEPLSRTILSKAGIYPLKGNIQQGGEATYNLYLKPSEGLTIEESELFHYHRDTLAVTVQRGKVVRAGQEVVFRSGFGDHIKINTPAYFKIDD
ncbi:hypothetical protein J7I93_17780 [Bacillus sp. ISL-47]|uniref:hypothetical protein n=1 Tax=Bacillus sp. ISL-47 TaxID=2819130 RepID=UPI001BEB5AFF|nr:hypothetical protein [Bacillus sp. ISL-47]MBT2690021.1 hypothetical protein [Bacillus sp. ISL-47]MBT2707815.1 hypothetical protein [Pseudomonas sp. ISL-84]